MVFPWFSHQSTTLWTLLPGHPLASSVPPPAPHWPPWPCRCRERTALGRPEQWRPGPTGGFYFNLYEFLKRRIHAQVGKLKNSCFSWFPAAIQGHKHGVFIQSFMNWVKCFSEYLTDELLHRPDSWQGFLYIYPLSFPRFQSFCIKRFPFLFLLSHLSENIELENPFFSH